MKRAPNEMLVQDPQPELEIERSRTPRRLLKLGAVASGAALALARLGGVGYAAGHDVGGSDRLAFDATGGTVGDLALMSGPAAPVIGQEVTAIGLGESYVYNGNGNGNGGGGHDNGNGNGGGHDNGSNHGNESNSASNSHNESNVSNSASNGSHNESNVSASHGSAHGDASMSTAKSVTSTANMSTAKSADDDASVSTVKSTQTGVASAKSSETTTTAATAQSTGAGAPTSHEDNGLHLGQLFHQGISESQAQALLDAMDGGSGLTVKDVQDMSLGELLDTAHGAGMSTQDLADILESNEVEAGESTP